MTFPTRRTLCNAALSVAIAGTLTLCTARAQNPDNPYPQQNNRQQNNASQRGVNPSTADMSVPDTDAPHNWTQNQILTATVHQAWELSGQNEANFFEIVKELAEISARNRNLVLPDTSDAGRRAGEYIKEQAKADHDQLLYDVVDKAVRMTGTPAPQSASTHDNDRDNAVHHDNDSTPHQ